MSFQGNFFRSHRFPFYLPHQCISYDLPLSVRGKYGSEENNYYRTPYGVFIAKKFTCARTTTALGRVLEFMGYEWEHVNENKWMHQWCILKMDGKRGHADPALGQDDAVGYGEYQSGETSVREVLEKQGKL